MSSFPLFLALVLAALVAVGYVVVLVGMRQEDRVRKLPVQAPTMSAGFARRVVGCHVRDDGPSRGASSEASRQGQTTPLRPVPAAASSRRRPYAA